MKPNKLLAVLFVFVLIAAACGGGDDNASTASPDSDQTSGNEETSNGGSDEGGGGGDEGASSGFTTRDARADAVGAGADFPIPIPGGWQVDQFALLEEEGASGFSGGVALEYASEDFDQLVAFYDEWTAAQPDEYARGEQENTVVYTKTSPLTQITISKDLDGPGTYTFLSISAATE
jgi:hypothetical protein